MNRVVAAARSSTLARHFLFLLVALGCPAPAASRLLSDVLLAVRLNGLEMPGAASMLKADDGGLLVRAGDLTRWGMLVPEGPAWRQDDEVFYPLNEFAGLSWRIDIPLQTLVVEAAPSLFLSTRINLNEVNDRNQPRVLPATPGGFLNYDLSSARTTGPIRSGALMELGAFNRFGSGTSTFVLRDASTIGPRMLRLETSWTYDLPAERASLRLGDTVGGVGQWGRPVRLGGVQWATNFATQPGFIVFPLPTMQGEAALPSTVELYLNGALQLRHDVPAGPFSLQQFPVVTGQGEARLLVRDLLGREQVIVAPYYASPRLLRTGLHDFSYEVGRIRENFGLASGAYGRTALLATYRVGLNDLVTVEGRGEWIESQRTAGVGAVLGLAGFGSVNAAFAGSRSDRTEQHAGALLSVGADHPSARLGFGINAQFATRHFEQAGSPIDRPAARHNLQSYLSVGTGHGSVSLSYVQQTPRDTDAVRLLSLGYSVSLGTIGFLGLSLVRNFGPQGGVAFNVNFTHSLDSRTYVNAGMNVRGGQNQGQLQLQRNPPAGDGGSYRLNAVTGASQRVAANGSWQHPAGTVVLDLDVSGHQAAMRASVSGGLAWIDNAFYASRRIDSSFAVVQVPGLAGVGVYADNQLVAHTGADGRALLPRLRAYQANPVRIEELDLPMDTQVDSIAMDVVPAWRSGLVLRFGVRRSRSATLVVLLENGSPVPTGAVASVRGGERRYAFGAAGRLYLEELGATNHIVVRWRPDADERRCEFELALEPLDDLIPELGIHTCSSSASP